MGTWPNGTVVRCVVTDPRTGEQVISHEAIVSTKIQVLEAGAYTFGSDGNRMDLQLIWQGGIRPCTLEIYAQCNVSINNGVKKNSYLVYRNVYNDSKVIWGSSVLPRYQTFFRQTEDGLYELVSSSIQYHYVITDIMGQKAEGDFSF